MTYRTKPEVCTTTPKGIPYIICNEAAERFSYYGMRAILTVFMTKYLVDSTGALDTMSPEDAKGYYHMFTSALYFFPILGAFFSDWLFGKYKTILALSIVYCAGHLALALDETRLGLGIGLALIAIGSGGIKPCVSAHVGDQFGKGNSHLMDKVFSWFYISINLGAFVSSLATPFLLDLYGPSVAFGVPGILMLLATIFFWMGRHSFIHVPPAKERFFKETFSKDGLKAVGKLSVVYAFVAMFWALFDQTGSAWVLQAEKMDRVIFGYELLPSQIQAANPVMILAFVPLISYLVYPFLRRVMVLTSLRKIAIGFFITVVAFLIPAQIEAWIEAGQTPSIGWQILSYVIITVAEIFVSITCLEFSYTQAPKAMKSIVMALYLASVSMGNIFVMAVNFLIQNPDGTSKLTGVDYYLFFSGTMLLAAVAFLGVIKWYGSEKPIIAEDPADKEKEGAPAFA